MSNLDNISPVIVCSQCHASVPVGKAFCPKCGAKISPGTFASIEQSEKEKETVKRLLHEPSKAARFAGNSVFFIGIALGALGGVLMIPVSCAGIFIGGIPLGGCSHPDASQILLASILGGIFGGVVAIPIRNRLHH